MINYSNLLLRVNLAVLGANFGILIKPNESQRFKKEIVPMISPLPTDEISQVTALDKFQLTLWDFIFEYHLKKSLKLEFYEPCPWVELQVQTSEKGKIKVEGACHFMLHLKVKSTAVNTQKIVRLTVTAHFRNDAGLQEWEFMLNNLEEESTYLLYEDPSEFVQVSNSAALGDLQGNKKKEKSPILLGLNSLKFHRSEILKFQFLLESANSATAKYQYTKRYEYLCQIYHSIRCSISSVTPSKIYSRAGYSLGQCLEESFFLTLQFQKAPHDPETYLISLGNFQTNFQQYSREIEQENQNDESDMEISPLRKSQELPNLEDDIQFNESFSHISTQKFIPEKKNSQKQIILEKQFKVRITLKFPKLPQSSNSIYNTLQIHWKNLFPDSSHRRGELNFCIPFESGMILPHKKVICKGTHKCKTNRWIILDYEVISNKRENSIFNHRVQVSSVISDFVVLGKLKLVAKGKCQNKIIIRGRSLEKIEVSLIFEDGWVWKQAL